MEKPCCCKHISLKVLSPSLNVKDTQNYACWCSFYPLGEASFSGEAAWERLRKNLLSPHRDMELISHNMEEWVGLGNSEISITGWVLVLVSWPVYPKISNFAPVSSISSCIESVYTCMYRHIHTLIPGGKHLRELTFFLKYLQFLNSYLSSLLRWASLIAFLVRMKLKRKIWHTNITQCQHPSWFTSYCLKWL